ncbi:hypothetical protein [Halorubrum aethiopicum]|uniref:hypothetical protein n=1 Tax=Halorubrum aethiopicum TaxID=1758255 RepID=UPI001E4685B3|nr:hypothetical protein [Halorubrum aethiopicum]
MPLYRYTTTTELLYLFEKNQLPTKPVSDLRVGCDIPEPECIEGVASLVWEELNQVAEYTEWYAEPEISRSTWDRFADATLALRSSKTDLLSQLPDQMARVEEVCYADLEDFSNRPPTDGYGNYPVDALGGIFGVKSSKFDNQRSVRVFVVPDGILDESDGMFSYSSLESFEGTRPEIGVVSNELIQRVEVSPNAPSYTEDVVKSYLDDHGLGSLMS